MTWFYKIEKPGSDLPMDEDRPRLYFRLVECPHCGERRSAVTHISPLDPAKMGSPELRRRWRKLRGNKSDDCLERWPDYEAFASQLLSEFPHLPASAAMEFGMIGVRVDRMVDLAAPGTGVVVLKKSLFSQLAARGLGIEGWPVKARFSKRISNPEEIVELAALPVATAAPGQNIKMCPACQRSDFDGRMTGRLGFHPCKLDPQSVPPNVDAFRIVESPINVIVSERVVEALEGYDCGNVLWTPVECG